MNQPNPVNLDFDPAVPHRVSFHVRQLTKIYRMGDVAVHALQSVSFDLYDGEFVVILGPSGSGKSTLLNILGGLDIPTSGQVLFHNRDLTHASDADLTRFRRDCVGFIFQFYNLIPSLTAREDVALVTEIARYPMHPEEALARAGCPIAWITFQPSYRVANSSGWRSLGPLRNDRKSYCAMNQLEHWITKPAKLC